MSDIPPPVPTTPSPLMTAEAAAAYLTISVPSLNRLRRDGRVHATYVVNDARYHREDLDAYIDQCREERSAS